MNILVIGKSGQVAQSLLECNSDALRIHAMGRNDIDLLDLDSIRSAVDETNAAAVINAAAYTAVDQAEDEPDQADSLNHIAVANIGTVTHEKQIPLVHISTDYVFDGRGEVGQKPGDPTGPLGVYGQTKLDGEKALLAICDNVAILRTSWVFSAHGSNFVKTMLRLGKERDSLNIVSDQIGGPTSAHDIASTALKIADTLVHKGPRKGIWHYSGYKDCSWADFAKEIFQQARISCAVHPIPSSEYPTPATRPLNSRLDCRTTKDDFGIKRPDWKQSLAEVLNRLETPHEST